MVRGIPVDKYSREDNVIIYVGLSSHIGCIRGRQDYQNNSVPADVMMAHIMDFSSSADSRSVTLPAYTDGEVIFHTDTGDIVSLFALEEPAHGGESLLASGWRVYNELAKTRPDLVEALASDWPIPRLVPSALCRNRCRAHAEANLVPRRRVSSYAGR